MLNAISLGAGVQSSTMALMAAEGEIVPMPDCAIFSDTQSEPDAVYEWLSRLETLLPFTVYRVTAGNLRELIASKKPTWQYRTVPIPAFVRLDNGDMGGLINRSCTRDFKIIPIKRKLRELLGLTRKKAPKHTIVTQWIGISSDEAHRMKPSRETWIEHRWPLVDLRMSRSDCLEWLKRRGYGTPPKSACVFCPFHDSEQWRRLTPEERETANLVDDSLRSHPRQEYRQKGTLFLHRSGKPLRDIDFRREPGLFDGFGNECEGMCGV